MTNRAYSIVHIKRVDAESRTITGIASTPSTDRMGDIVEPKGAKFKLPIPLLWQHKHDQPIGEVTHATVTPNGIEIVARLTKVDEPGTLKDRLDEAWHAIKSGLVRGLSIGFRALDNGVEWLDGGGLRFTAWEWFELSAVTIPANADASIQSVKRYDVGLAPSGMKAEPEPVAKAVSPTKVDSWSAIEALQHHTDWPEFWGKQNKGGKDLTFRIHASDEYLPPKLRKELIRFRWHLRKRERAAKVKAGKLTKASIDWNNGFYTRREVQDEIGRALELQADNLIQLFIESCGGALNQIRREFEKKLEESRFEYRGVWSGIATYRRNHGVTYGGSFWVAKVDEPSGAPGSNPSEWQLAVKRGRDAR